MIRVGVVDDDVRGRNVILARRYQTEHNVRVSAHTFRDGREIALSYRPEFDIIFLDVEMAGMDGFDAARIIREHDERVILVFVTVMGQLAIRGYEVNALTYLGRVAKYWCGAFG